MTKPIWKKEVDAFIIVSVVLSMFIFAAGFFGCSDSTTAPAQINNMSLSGISSADTIGDLQDIIRLDTVKILIKDIKMELSNTAEDSSEFKTGPFVMFMDMSSDCKLISSAFIPAGDYKKIKFEVHKLNDNETPPDLEFADSNGRYSVIVKGWYLGNYFVYRSTKSAHQILQFPDNIPFTSISVTNITLTVKPYIWFIKNGTWMNPMVNENSNDIDNNIKDNINHNFKAFRDNDKNGMPD
ncbi:MAG: hypothetical protein PHN88_01235 [Ignavibacteria bacterium]|nr:hypothetical protein [Ignavibacteria bacterium]